MLYLRPPFPVVNGVSFFPDHEDPLQFYWMPLAPHLTQTVDPAGGGMLPHIQVIKYKGGVGTDKEINGGFLNFDCDIGIDDQTLQQLSSKLQQMLSLSDHPRLAPLPVVDGSVKLLLFGSESPPPPPAGGSHSAGGGTAAAAAVDTSPTGDPTGPKFVTKITQGAKPSLYGDNEAAFSVALDQYGVTVLEQALKGAMSPIGIVYSLDYVALRQAYQVKLSIDWDRVQTRMDEDFGVNTLFFSSDIDKVVDKLIEDRVIELDVDTFVAEGDSDSDVLTRRDQAVSEVRDMITNAFFTSSIDPAKPEKDGWDKAASFAQTLAEIPEKSATGGALFSYNKLDYTRIDKKKLDVTMNERTTVKRTIYPQGHLVNMFQGLDLSKFIMDVNLDDPFFMRRRLQVISRANFDADLIESVNVDMNYNGDPKNVLLVPSQTTFNLEWASDVENGRLKKDLTYSYSVNFKEGHPAFNKPIASAPQNFVDDAMEIRPSDLFSVVTVPILTLGLPWDRYPMVQVNTRYVDDTNGIHMEEIFNLTKDKPSDVWRIFARDPAKRSFDYKLTYRAVDNRDIVRDWTTTTEEQVTIRDPIPLNQKRQLQVVAVADWNKVQEMFVDLFYDDLANNVSLQNSIAFQKTDSIEKSASFDLKDPTARRVAYEVTVIFANGTVAQIPRSYTLDTRILVRPDMKAHRIVTVKSNPASDFAASKIKEIDVQLKYEDSQASLSYLSSATLSTAAAQAVFEFDYVDPAKSAYQYQTTTLLKNGMSKTSDWLTANDPELVIATN
jgi:hypothetical protein